MGLVERMNSNAPVSWLFQVQKFEDRFAVHIRRRVEPSNVQDRRGQVDVKNNLWDSAKTQIVTAQTQSQWKAAFRAALSTVVTHWPSTLLALTFGFPGMGGGIPPG